MIPQSWSAYLLLLLFVYTVEGDQCTIVEELPPEEGFCTAQIECQHNIELSLKSGEWDCISHTRYSYNDYHYNRRQMIHTYDSTYNLKITVKNPYGSDQLLFNNEEDNIVELILENGTLLSIPEEIYKMSRLKNISVSGNQISTVKFSNFLPLLNLNNISITNNSMSVIEVDDQTVNSPADQSNVKIIDISNNKIEELPNKFLSKFNQLQDLNVSHNMIGAIGLLTFEGISQLQILDISHNKLVEFGNAFVRFVNLKNLVISNNYIAKFIDLNFMTLANLVKLNASSNDIIEIENNTFQNLINLEELDLSNNKIEMITDQLFKNNNNLRLLVLFNNRIQHIEANSFINTKVQDFLIKNNEISGTLNENTFNGLNIDELNLSGGNLTCINNDAFTGMSELKTLNISYNAINNISNLAFSTLISLQILDLSQNQLKDLSFETADLKNLSKLFAHNNKIKKITENVFKNFDSLIELDLSYNDIEELEPQSFLNLNHLELLKLRGSNFVNALEPKAFEGLTSVHKIDLSQTRTTCFQNESFSGLGALTSIYSEFGQLSDIQYNAFFRTGSLEKLSLSNNQLRYFHINISTILRIQEINLDNNFIRNISRETFSRLDSLRNLNLANNDIIALASDVFLGINKLKRLDLSSNTKMIITGNPFKHLSNLDMLLLNTVKTEITFENSSATTETLHLQSCNIIDIDKVNIYNVHDLAYLYLGSNMIANIDKDSFRNMPSLVSLDLSMNKIIYIQPGSFLHLNNLESLNLFGNNLPSIQFGTFDGLKVLKELNLSSNVLSYLEIKLLPSVTKLCLDDNIIANFDFKALFEEFDPEIVKLSIGGNQIPCNTLTELKSSNESEKIMSAITAKTLDYHSENINGISCRTISNGKFNMGSGPDNQTNDFSSLIISLRNYVDKFGKSVETIANQYTIKSDNVDSEMRNATKLLEHFMNSSNYNQMTINDFLTKIADIGNNSNIQLEEIKYYLFNLTMTLQKLQPDTEFNSNKLSDDQSILRSEFKKMLEQENDALRKEFKMALASILTNNSSQAYSLLLESPKKDSGESNAVFYFIAICLAILVVAFISNFAYKYVTKLRGPRYHLNRNLSTTTSISNNIEMG